MGRHKNCILCTKGLIISHIRPVLLRLPDVFKTVINCSAISITNLNKSYQEGSTDFSVNQVVSADICKALSNVHIKRDDILWTLYFSGFV